MGEESYYNNGVLSDVDIQREMKNGNIFIAPFTAAQLQPSGYNLTPTRFFYSTKKKQFLPVMKNEEEIYVMVDRNDTVLVRTRESVAISSMLTGAFYSKVKVVSEGFGHVSTTLDPNWEGQLLISLNNPTNRKLKFSIEKEVYGKRICNSFVTLEFMYLNQEAKNVSDNTPGRLDILDSTIERNLSRFERKRIADLQNLRRQLEDQEKKIIEYLIQNQLSEDEKQEWEQINIIHDETAYNVRRKEFLRAKKAKYLRPIQNDYAHNAEISIDIVNEFIEKKQKYISKRKRFLMFIMKYMYIWINFVFFACALVALQLVKKHVPDIDHYEIVLNIVFYLVMPLIVVPITASIKNKG